MKIGIISDSHDRLPALEQAIRELCAIPVEAILHAGDFVAPFAAKYLAPPYVPEGMPVHVIYGNNDGERAGLKKILPQLIDGPTRMTLGGCRIAMHHFIDWLDPEEIEWADVIVSGHNHELSIEHRGDKLFINPGECCGWLTGRCTCVVLDSESRQVEVIDLLNPRSPGGDE